MKRVRCWDGQGEGPGSPVATHADLPGFGLPVAAPTMRTALALGSPPPATAPSSLFPYRETLPSSAASVSTSVWGGGFGSVGPLSALGGAAGGGLSSLPVGATWPGQAAATPAFMGSPLGSPHGTSQGLSFGPVARAAVALPGAGVPPPAGAGGAFCQPDRVLFGGPMPRFVPPPPVPEFDHYYGQSDVY